MRPSWGSSMKTYTDKLPPRYRSWLDLWNHAKDKIDQHTIVNVTFCEYGLNEERYETTLDFIKARCFEELSTKIGFYIDQLKNSDVNKADEYGSTCEPKQI